MRMDEMHGVPSEGTSMFLPHLHVYRLVLVFRGIHISIDEGLMRAPIRWDFAELTDHKAANMRRS